MFNTILKSSLLSILVVTIVTALYSLKINNIHSIGAFDFVYYHTPFQVFKSGENPYDIKNLAQEFSKIPKHEEHDPLIFLYAPHILILLSPFLYWNFSTSVTIWIFTNLFLLITSSYSAVKETARTDYNKITYLAFIAAIFPPAYESISWGQGSLVLTLGIIGVYSTIKNNKPFWFGFFLLLCSIKPHLTIGITFYLLIYLLKNKKYDFIKSWFIWFSILLVITELSSTGIWSNWIDSFKLSANHGMNMLNPVLVDLIQLISLISFNKIIIWPAFFIPILGSLICSLLGLKQNFEANFIFVIIISYLFAPYGWYYDQSMLILVYVYTLVLATQTGRKLTALAILPIILLIIFKLFIGHAQHHYLWFPIILFCNLILVKKLSTRKHFAKLQL